MHRTSWLLWLTLAACSSDEAAPPATAGVVQSTGDPVPAGAPASAATAGARPVAPAAGLEADRQARAILERSSATVDPAALGNAPMELAALGTAALPALEAALRTGDLRTRRIAVLALLQMGTVALPAAGTLDHVSRHDADPDIRAAALRAHLRATSDTSELDAARAAMEAAERANR